MSSMEEKEEIEITPEMMDAGFEAWRRYVDIEDPIEWTLTEIYTAMEKARRYDYSRSPIHKS